MLDIGAVVVYLSIPTSNHNKTKQAEYDLLLYIYLFLHQTTTLFIIY